THRQSAIAGQPVPPVLESAPEHTLDEQAAKSGAVDEEISFDASAALEGHRLDESVLATQPYVDDLPFGSLHPPSLRIRAQHAAVKPGVELKRVFDAGHGTATDIIIPCHPAGLRRGRVERITREIFGV